MKVLICGGRDFNNFAHVKKVMDEIHSKTPVELVISGKARGADALGEQWAISKNIPIDPYPANWNDHGKAAGPIRNQQMLDEGKPDLVVAFPGGNGTRDMINRSKRANVRVFEVQREDLQFLSARDIMETLSSQELFALKRFAPVGHPWFVSGSPEHFEFANLYAEKVSRMGEGFETNLSKQTGFVPTNDISNLIRETLTPYKGEFLADKEKSYNRGDR